MPRLCIGCDGGKLLPLDRNGDLAGRHAQGSANRLGGATGVPVCWREAGYFAVPRAAMRARGRYDQVIALVDPEHAVQSLPPGKPPNQHHLGGLRNGFDASRAVGARIREDFRPDRAGAVCGATAAQCAQ